MNMKKLLHSSVCSYSLIQLNSPVVCYLDNTQLYSRLPVAPFIHDQQYNSNDNIVITNVSVRQSGAV
jgi:hypothetical protein